jgi:hypothetical protein
MDVFSTRAAQRGLCRLAVGACIHSYIPEPLPTIQARGAWNGRQPRAIL